MNLQVESLKVLVTRQVVMNRMDYSNYLNGTVKEELDGLDRLAGKFRVQASKLTIVGLHGQMNAEGRGREEESGQVKGRGKESMN